MDTFEKIKNIKNEYKSYLTNKHPDWAESTASTHVSDAFYIWNNSVLPGFWKVFISDETMENARTSLLLHFRDDVKSPNYEQRTTGYFKDLQMLKEYIDNVLGGIQSYAGDELWAEETVYELVRAYYDGNMQEDRVLDELTERVPNFNRTSHKMTLSLFSYMMDGRKYTRRASVEFTLCFIKNIGRDYGMDKMYNAVAATWENIAYYYGKTGNKSNCLRKCCQQICIEHGFDLLFDESMFTGITPVKSNTSTLADDDVDTVRYWIYSPGDNACKWDEFYTTGIMGIGWGGIGDLSELDSKDEMKKMMKTIYGDQYSYKNAAHATWQFANEIKPGDIVFVKKGMHKVIGRGVVVGDYQYRPEFVNENNDCL